jgi:hypothetical protein
MSGVNILPVDLVTGTLKQARKLRQNIFTLPEVTQWNYCYFPQESNHIKDKHGVVRCMYSPPRLDASIQHG